MRFVRKILDKRICNAYGIPEKYRDEIKREIITLNIKRERILAIALSAIVLIILSIILFVDDPVTIDKYVSRKSLNIHMVLLISSLAYIIITHKTGKLKMRSLYRLEISHTAIINIVIIHCAVIAINNELINQRPFAYIIAMFSIAAVVILDNFERYTIFFTSYIVYISGIIYLAKDFAKVFESFIFSFPLLGLAMIVSGINYKAFISNYVNNMLVQEKNQQLDSLYRITEEMLQKRTEQLNQAIEMEKIRTAFFSNISHELRTPLNLIFSAEQLLDNIFNQPDIERRRSEIRKYNGIIKQNCYRLIRLIENLIDITKIDSGHFDSDFRNYDIVKIIEDITMSVASYIEDKNITLTFDTDFEEKVITCDVDKIERIMLNLLSNAVKFTHEGGAIYVSVSAKESNVVIKVKDTGIGIPQSMRDKVFERFIQVDKTTTRIREGSGIGLSIVTALVEMHGGTISLISEEGKGSEFTIELPININTDEKKDAICICKEHENVEKIKIEFSDIYN